MKLYSYPFKLCQISMLCFFFCCVCVIFYRNSVCIIMYIWYIKYLILYLSILWLLNINSSRLPDRQMAETKKTPRGDKQHWVCMQNKKTQQHSYLLFHRWISKAKVSAAVYTLRWKHRWIYRFTDFIRPSKSLDFVVFLFYIKNVNILYFPVKA